MSRPKTLFVILSYANSERTKNYTLNAVMSLINSTDDSKQIFGICIVETNSKEQWGALKPFVEIIHPFKEFNYNEFANIGIKHFIEKRAEFDFKNICLCNNDLFFHKEFYSPLIKQILKYDSLSPRCGLSDSNRYLNQELNLKEVVEGYQTAKQLNGWCLFLRRNTYDRIGGFDEDFSFWCADDSYREQLLKLGLTHAVCINSRVDHLDNGSNTIMSLTDEVKKQEYTISNIDRYRAKFNKG